MRKALALIGYVLLLAIFITPMLWVAASALRTPGSLYEYSSPLSWRTFVPTSPTLANFRNVLLSLGMGQALRNTVLMAIATVVLGLIVNSMAGFALAVMDFPFKSLVFAGVLLALAAPFDAIVIPLHQAVSRMGIINSPAALVLPAVGNGMAIFLFRQFYLEMPHEMIEAARVDGASWARVFWQIVTPLSAPAMASAAVVLFMGQWNALFWPLVAAFSDKFRMVQVVVATQISADGTHWANLFASAVLSSIPPMALFFTLQKHYLRGVGGFGSN